MTDIKDHKTESSKTNEPVGLSTTDIIKMSEEIGSDWLNKQLEKIVNQRSENKAKEDDKKDKYSFV